MKLTSVAISQSVNVEIVLANSANFYLFIFNTNMDGI
jgi:hypothetical protein